MGKGWRLYAWWYSVLLCHGTVYAEFQENIDLSLNAILLQPTVQLNQIFKCRIGKSIVSLTQWKNMEALPQLPPASLVSYSHSDRVKISVRKISKKNLLKSKVKFSIRVQLEIRIVRSPEQLCHPLRFLAAYLASPRIHARKYRAEYCSHWLYFIIIFWVLAEGLH